MEPSSFSKSGELPESGDIVVPIPSLSCETTQFQNPETPTVVSRSSICVPSIAGRGSATTAGASNAAKTSETENDRANCNRCAT